MVHRMPLSNTPSSLARPCSPLFSLDLASSSPPSPSPSHTRWTTSSSSSASSTSSSESAKPPPTPRHSARQHHVPRVGSRRQRGCHHQKHTYHRNYHPSCERPKQKRLEPIFPDRDHHRHHHRLLYSAPPLPQVHFLHSSNFKLVSLHSSCLRILTSTFWNLNFLLRTIVFRRVALIAGLLYMYRGVTMFVTVLPMSGVDNFSLIKFVVLHP